MPKKSKQPKQKKQLDARYIIEPAVGMPIGNWTVLELTSRVYGNAKYATKAWRLVCGCGKTNIVADSRLRTGSSLSCGCGKYRGRSDNAYNNWRNIRARSLDENNKAYYGLLCERWQNYPAFLKDMGMPPEPGCHVHRIDRSKGYEPGNCVYLTATEHAKVSAEERKADREAKKKEKK
jgi:hypothetical protein